IERYLYRRHLVDFGSCLDRTVHINLHGEVKMRDDKCLGKSSTNGFPHLGNRFFRITFFTHILWYTDGCRGSRSLRLRGSGWSRIGLGGWRIGFDVFPDDAATVARAFYVTKADASILGNFPCQWRSLNTRIV